MKTSRYRSKIQNADSAFARPRFTWAARVFVAAFLFFAFAFSPLTAQQITRVAVLDMARLLAAFPKAVEGLKNFEAKKAEIQTEVNRQTAEIKRLQEAKVDAENSHDYDYVQRLEREISSRTLVLKNYAAARQNELDLMAKALSAGTPFAQKLGVTVAQVAEAEGYSLVLNLTPQQAEANLVLWNSPAVDITDKVIQALSAAFPSAR